MIFNIIYSIIVTQCSLHLQAPQAAEIELPPRVPARVVPWQSEIQLEAMMFPSEI